MALYTIEIVAASKNPKALHLIADLSGLGIEEIRQRLKSPPLLIKESIPLAEAVSIERQLRRLGLATRVRKVDVQVESFEEGNKHLEPIRKPEDEIIIIPEEEVRVLPPPDNQPPKPRIVRRFAPTPFMIRSAAMFLAAVAVIVIIIMFLLSNNSTRQNESELAIAIEQHAHTLNQQEALLDKGMTPQQIYAKLSEIEAKINRLFALLKSRRSTQELKVRYEQSQIVHRGLKRDLEFRRRLDEAGYPIHPTCLVDQGMVRGVSELPDGSMLRITVSTYAANEPPPLNAQIKDGIFRIILDPLLERTVFDARATVASFSQQPAEVQQWVEERFTLNESAPQVATSPEPVKLAENIPLLQNLHSEDSSISRPQSMVGEESVPNRESNQDLSVPRNRESNPDLSFSRKRESISESKISANVPPPTISPKDSLADMGMVTALGCLLDDWSGQVREAEGFLHTGQVQFLEAIFQRLVSLESRVDHMIHLLVTDEAQNQAIMMREDAYGMAVVARQDLQRWHESFLTRCNPLYLETALRRGLAYYGFTQAQVIVQTSPSDPNAFTVSIQAGQAEKEALYSAIASTIAEEVRRTPVNLEMIRLTWSGKERSWPCNTLREAYDALKYPDGPRRCAALMESKSK